MSRHLFAGGLFARGAVGSILVCTSSCLAVRRGPASRPRSARTSALWVVRSIVDTYLKFRDRLTLHSHIKSHRLSRLVRLHTGSRTACDDEQHTSWQRHCDFPHPLGSTGMLCATQHYPPHQRSGQGSDNPSLCILCAAAVNVPDGKPRPALYDHCSACKPPPHHGGFLLSVHPCPAGRQPAVPYLLVHQPAIMR